MSGFAGQAVSPGVLRDRRKERHVACSVRRRVAETEMTKFPRISFALVLFAASALAVWGCAGKNQLRHGGHSGGASGGEGSGDDGGFGSFGSSGGNGGGGCTNLQCQVHSCSGGGTTTISGRVLDPAGRNPLYNVVVYVPNSPGGKLDAIPSGVDSSSCSCGALYSGQPMAATLTDANGAFTLPNAPDGGDIPLVVQIGKWRKEVVIKNVAACQDNPQGSITLPKSSAEGNLPNIAVSTGLADTLECLLRRVGVDPGEYTGDPGGAGHVHVFQGSGGNAAANPASAASPTALWDSSADLDRYDVVLLSCEGDVTTGANSQSIADYVNAGGRVFAEHYHYAFFANQPQFANTANWNNVGSAASDMYSGDVGGVVETSLLSNGNPFPEGQALQTWLGNVGALTNGELVIPGGNGRYNAVVGPSNLATAWVVTDQNAQPASTQYFSWDMPFDAPLDDAGTPGYCGRVVFSDLHVTGSVTDYANSTTVPDGCVDQALTPDEDALEFILFDLSSCVTPVGQTPMPPPTQGPL
jgi:hypothetical protein